MREKLHGQFYRTVIQFYRPFVKKKKQPKSFDFGSPVLHSLSDQVQCMPLSTCDQIADSVAISFDKQQTKLEHQDFATDCSMAPTEGEMQLTVGTNITFSITHGKTLL